MNLPCVSCADIARDCGTCSDYGAWLAAVDPDPPACLTCTDADWLILSGEAWPQVAARLGMQPNSLVQHLRRHGRDDLIPTGAQRRAS